VVTLTITGDGRLCGRGSTTMPAYLLPSLREALAGGDDPRPLLGQEDVFDDLGQHPTFVAALAGALRDIGRDGVDGAVRARLGSDLQLAA
jgi:mannitol-1-phosphate/altronate dehydrogenase